jgi:hypothetical protein
MRFVHFLLALIVLFAQMGESSAIAAEAPEFKFPHTPIKALPLPREFDPRKRIVFEDGADNVNLPALADGGTHGGGGGGLACYAPGAEHKDENLLGLYVFDTYEGEFMKPVKDAETFIANVHQYRSPVDYAHFVVRMKLEDPRPRMAGLSKLLHATINEVASQLKQCRSLSYLDDRGRRLVNESEVYRDRNCEPIQLAYREPVNSSDEDAPGKDFKITFDCEKYDRLGPRATSRLTRDTKIKNQAMLIVHEAVYLIAARIGGHTQSLRVRDFVQRLFWPHDLDWSELRYRYSLRELGLDSYFMAIPVGANDSQERIKVARQKSYRSAVLMMGNLRRLIAPLYVGESHDAQFFTYPFIRFDFPVLAQLSFERGPQLARLFQQALAQELLPRFTDEEAFLFAASFLSDLGVLSEWSGLHFESLLAPGEDDRATVKAVCDAHRLRYEDAELAAVLIPKVSSYCASLASRTDRR